MYMGTSTNNLYACLCVYNYLSSVHCINLFEYEIKILKYKKKNMGTRIISNFFRYFFCHCG